jgi:hypothetical protein
MLVDDIIACLLACMHLGRQGDPIDSLEPVVCGVDPLQGAEIDAAFMHVSLHAVTHAHDARQGSLQLCYGEIIASLLLEHMRYAPC